MNQSDSFGENTMTNENLTACLASQFCDGLWDSYTKKYPVFVNRISPIFVHLAVYQHLVSHSSIIGSKGRQRQQELVESFEQWYEGIEHARAINWIDLNLTVLDTIQAVTGDYSYGFNSSGAFIRDHSRHYALESNLNHQLFQMLPISKSVVAESNINVEIVRQIKSRLTGFWDSSVNASTPGEQELFELLVQDISRLLIGTSYESRKAHDLDVYLYLFQNAALGNNKSKQECAQLASLIQVVVKDIQSQGSEPSPIESIWQMGLGYPEQLVKDYNQLVAMLDSQVFTVCREDIADGFELSVWRYPHKEQTQQKIVLRGDGCFELMGVKPLSFNEAGGVVRHLMSVITRDD